MRIAQIRSLDISNGPGIRISVFCSGCTHFCKGCFNVEAQKFDYGTEYSDQTQQQILDLCKSDFVSGLSLLGGEPAHPKNRDTMTLLAKAFKERFPEKTIWLWSGYLYEQIKDIELLKYVDVLVDGPFIEELKDLRLKFRGSSNQRIIDINKTRETDEIILYENL